MDKNLANSIGKEAENALKAVATKYGVILKYKGGSFSNSSFVAKFEFSSDSDEEKYEKEWKQWAHAVGLKDEWLGKEILISNGEYVKIIGLNISRRKYPVVLKYKNGKITGTTVDVLKRFIK